MDFEVVIHKGNWVTLITATFPDRYRPVALAVTGDFVTNLAIGYHHARAA